MADPVDGNVWAQKDVVVAIITVVGGLVGALIGGAIGVLGTWLAMRKTNKTNELASLQANILKISEFAMQYPHVEKTAYCHSYPNCVGDPNGKERYENYCVFVFNVVGMAYGYFNGKHDEICKFLNVDEIVQTHHKWWFADALNLDHGPKFRAFIQEIYDRLKKGGKIT